MTRPLTIAVTGVNAHDNPGPGISVIRGLRLAEGRSDRMVGLAYDSLEPGIYAREWVDDAFLIPYPSQGPEALEQRIRYIHEQTPLDVIIPTLDSELPAFIGMAATLEELGIHTFMPTLEQYDLRSKAHLTALGTKSGLPVPATKMILEERELYRIHEEIPFPLFVKGVYYGARMARDVGEAVAAFHGVVAKWGLPVIIQERVQGQEYDVVAVGDGEGGLVGAVPMRKTYLTDKGKGWAGVAVKDPGLIEQAERFMAASHWRGPCEVEVIKDPQGRYQLLEINPRFPAWTFLSAAAGMNLPWAVVELALGQAPSIAHDFEAGTMFVRIAVDQVARLEDLEAITTTGEIHHRADASDEDSSEDDR